MSGAVFSLKTGRQPVEIYYSLSLLRAAPDKIKSDLEMLAVFYSICIGALACALGFFICRYLCARRELTVLRTKLHTAEKLITQRGLLANEIAHEIKNPITAILCSAETLDLLVGPSLDETNRKSLRFIREFGDNLLRLVSDFLDVSRAESHVIKAVPERVDIEKAVGAVTGLLRPYAQRKSIEIECHHLVDHWDAVVDPIHIKQIIFNLLHNAIKFTPEHGKVQILCTTEFPEPWIKITVKDNGLGIPEAAQQEIFNIYGRYEGNDSRQEVGVGLGLALCKNLVELAGGKIEVSSKQGIGTSFTVELPATPAEEKPNEQITPEQHLAQPLLGQKFLVVDVDEGVCEAMAALIRAWGGVADATTAIHEMTESLDMQGYDAVMLDERLYGEVGQVLQLQGGKEQNMVILPNTKPIDVTKLLANLIQSGRKHVAH